MKKKKRPQQSLVFRLVGFLARCQLRYLVKNAKNVTLVLALFVALEGIIAVGIIATAAYLTDFPLLFPPLGPSALVIFLFPMSVRASPRAVILSHGSGILAGVLSLNLFLFLFPEIMPDPGMGTSWMQIAVIVLSMFIVCVFMITMNAVHPPAVATALMGALGFLQSVEHVLGLSCAVLFLVAQAMLFNRLFAGLPYPLWRADPKVMKQYGALAGLPVDKSTLWSQLADKIFEKRE